MQKKHLFFYFIILNFFFHYPLRAEVSPFDRDMAAVRQMLSAGQNSEALVELRRLVGVYPDRPQVQFLLGLTAVNVASNSSLNWEEELVLLDEAIAAFEWVLEYESRRGNAPARVLLEIGQAHFFKGETEKAKKYFEQVIQDNSSPEAVNHARSFLDSIREPIIHEEEASKLESDMAVVQKMLNENRNQEALVELRRLVTVYPDRPQLQFLLGLAAIKLTRNSSLEREEEFALLDEAITAFEWVLDYESRRGNTPARVLLEIGQAHFFKGEDAQAKKYFAQVIQDNSSPEAVNHARSFLDAIGKRGIHDEEASKIESDIAAVQEMLGREETRGALVELRRLVREVYPENPQVHFLLGLTAINLAHNPSLEEEEREQLVNEAITAFEWVLDYESRQDNPPPVQVLFEIGRAHFIKEENDEAKKYFEQVIGNNPSSELADNATAFLNAIKEGHRYSIGENEVSEFDKAIAAVQEMLDKGEMEEALAELRRLEREIYPEHSEVHFLLGITAVNRAHDPSLEEEEREQLIDEAITAFEWVLAYESREGHSAPVRVLLEIGRAHFIKEENDEAKKYFEQVIGNNPSSEIADNATAFLNAIKEGRRYFIGERGDYEFTKAITGVYEMLDAGKVEEALQELRRLRRDVYPDRPQVHFELGVIAVNIAHGANLSKKERDELLDEALTAFEMVLEHESSRQDGEQPHNRILLEIGRAHFLKEQDKEAKKYFQRVAKSEPPPEVMESVNAFLDTIKQRKPWYVRLETTLTYDTNVGGFDKEKEIIIFGLPFKRNEDAEIKKGFGLSVGLSGGYSHSLDSGVVLNFGGNIYHKDYTVNRQESSTTATVHVGTPLLSKRGKVEPSVFVRKHFEDGKSEYYDVGVRANFDIAIPSPQWQLGGNVSWYKRRYHTDEKELNGPGNRLGLGVSYIVNPSVRLNLRLGREESKPEESIKSRYVNRSIEPGIDVNFDRGFSLGVSYRMETIQYKGPWRPFNEDGSARKDKVRSLRIDIRRRDFTLMDFDPNIALVFDKRTSNAQLHNYKRTKFELGFLRSW